MILADDLGWADLSSYGAPHISTPNIDRLAREGVRFTDNYAASSSCSPTRFGLYTGQFPGRTPGGLAEPIGRRGTVGLEPGRPTLATQLKAAGYRTAMFGKWHCGYLPDYSPTRSGWETFFGNMGGALDYFSKRGLDGKHDLYEGETPYKDLRYYTTVLTERAVDWIGARKDESRPWLLNLNYTTPHWPWETEDDAALSARLDAEFDAGRNEVLTTRDTGSVETYAKMVESLDRAVGKVLAALRASGAERNTLVLFTSDNGGEAYSYRWPLNGGKHQLQEGGLRVPAVLRWPERVDSGQVSHEPVVTMDWTATFIDVAGAREPASHPLDGDSLAGWLLRGEKLGDRPLFWRTEHERALREGRWKYYRGPGGRDKLFDLTSDVREIADKAADEPDRVTAMRRSWEKTAATLLPYTPGAVHGVPRL